MKLKTLELIEAISGVQPHEIAAFKAGYQLGLRHAEPSPTIAKYERRYRKGTTRAAAERFGGDWFTVDQLAAATDNEDDPTRHRHRVACICSLEVKKGKMECNKASRPRQYRFIP